MYKQAFFNFLPKHNGFFMTNDLGDYITLNASDFQSFIGGTLPEDHPIFSELMAKGFYIQKKIAILERVLINYAT